MAKIFNTIEVNASGNYQVIVGENLLEKVGEFLSPLLSPCKIAVITDDIVDGLYAKQVINSLENSGFQVFKFVFKKGEESKNLSTYGEILSFLARHEFSRTDGIVALGGGVVGDISGFVAATFLRGIKYIQIPTTLLAQIDSSVGGKTAVDLPEGKNLVGAFKQPSLVVCDVKTLSTLTPEIFTDGMGEMAKYALLDREIYTLLSKNAPLESLISACIDYKRKIVEEDEFESGLRKLLNLGHTPAHGIENLSGYTIPHGKAVAMGLDIILSASKKHNLITDKDFEDMQEVVKKCVGKISCPFSLEETLDKAVNDKKRSGDFITLIMVFGIGDCRPVKVEINKLKEYLG